MSFEWGTTPSYGNAVGVDWKSHTGTFNQGLNQLTPGTPYYYRAKAQGIGTTYGEGKTFITGSPSGPIIIVGDPSTTNVGSSTARLHGNLTKVGDAGSATVSFQYGLTTAYGDNTTPVVLNAAQPYSADISGLNPATLYHFRAKAVTSVSTNYSPDATFTTTPAIYTVTTNISGGHGNVTPLGAYSVNSGASYSANITPDDGYVVASITDNGQPKTPATSYNITAVTEDHYILIGFGQVFSINGETRDANAALLASTTVTLDASTNATSDASGFYRMTTNVTGEHSVVASKSGYRNQTRVVHVSDNSSAYTLNFKGVNGLIPNAPSLSYVLACSNKWRFPPHGSE